ncbi:Tat (twin-arginine translocation) pathway signal sequence [Parapedobacter composti]|uniref:Tat (Twin-arginine translocation) pathway signal sequence n=1 Tax=Parapedobacter composti TaxID=623281 RepID=A0A1I1E558_9SPHI|nr:Gfo/Idh/MocA family oxidoreductase [Parapedobacter composti]SFB82244.1 Tat (twin-arginine translocation) pathway signal sequence [Parapedobacter composti]
MDILNTRREFLKDFAALGVGLSFSALPMIGRAQAVPVGKRVGIIGLDTSHSIAFSKALNATNADPGLKGYKVIAAYPYGSRTIASSVKRIPGYIDEMKGLGVRIVDSIAELLEQVDVVLLETNDGRLHLEQALPVFKAGKRLFIDKPIAASLADAKAIFEASETYGVPTFSSSSLRYVENIPDLKSGKLIGNITGVDAFAPATLEPSHPDLFWYGIHGIEILYAVLGTGCQEVRRIYGAETDIVVGTWADGRVGVFRGLRSGKNGYGGMAYGEKGQAVIGKYSGYLPLLYHIVEYFDTGVVPISPAETLELVAFMEAADLSKRKGGGPINVQKLLS